MSKTLITVDNLDQFVSSGTVVMDASRILTAGARDELTRRGVDIVYGEGEAAAVCGAPTAAGQYDEDMLIGVAAIIRQHYGITDADTLRRVTLETVGAISKGA